MKLLTTTAMLAALTAWSGSASAACDRMEKVSAVWLPIMQTTAYYVALEEKLFEKACIEIVSNKLEAPNQIIDALVGARADFGPPGAAAGSPCWRNRSFRGPSRCSACKAAGSRLG